MKHISKPLISLTLLLSLFGCTTSSPTPSIIGLDKSSLLQSLGKPIRVSTHGDGERWNYSRGTDGLSTYFIYIDREGKVSRYEQVLSDANFDRIKSGMTQDEVIKILGDPPKRHPLGRERGYVWSYRTFDTICIWFQIEFRPDDVVRSTGYNRRPTGIPCR